MIWFDSQTCISPASSSSGTKVSFCRRTWESSIQFFLHIWWYRSGSFLHNVLDCRKTWYYAMFAYILCRWICICYGIHWFFFQMWLLFLKGNYSALLHNATYQRGYNEYSLCILWTICPCFTCVPFISLSSNNVSFCILFSIF